jgi:GTP:adenosylcobinamide-phosphate guanylyltransferase
LPPFSFTTIAILATMTRQQALFTAIVPAGHRPGAPDPLAVAHAVTFKAQVPVHGLPMLARVVQTLLASAEVADIIILAQEPDLLLADSGLAWLASTPRVRFERSGNSISAAVHHLLVSGRAQYPVLLTTADHALLTPAMIAHFARESSAPGNDIAVAMVERDVLTAAYPGNQRTWLKFTDGWWSGANMFALFSSRVLPALALWQSIEQDRKKGWKIIAAFGPWLLVRMLLKTLSLRTALAKAGHRLGLKAALVAMPMAEACIDVDKESDLVLAEQILKARDLG